MTDKNRRFRQSIVRWLRRNTIKVSIGTVIMYVLLIPISMLFFPDTNLVVSCLVLLTGLTSSLAALGSLLIDLDE